MGDWRINPTVKERMHVQYLSQLKKVIDEHGSKFTDEDLAGYNRNHFFRDVLNYCLDRGFLSYISEDPTSHEMSLNAGGVEALSDLKKYKVKKLIEILQNKKTEIDGKIERLLAESN